MDPDLVVAGSVGIAFLAAMLTLWALRLAQQRSPRRGEYVTHPERRSWRARSARGRR